MSQAGDDTHIVTREGIMPEEEHPRQLQVSSEQHKKDKAEKKHEQRKQRRAKSKACTDRDLVKFRDAQLTKSNSEDAQEQAEEQLVRRESARQREQQRQQRHRLKEQAAQQHQKAEEDATREAQAHAHKQAKQEELRKENARERKRRSRAAASYEAASAEEDLPHGKTRPLHPELIKMHECRASMITMNAMRLEPLKRVGLLDELRIAKADTCADTHKYGSINVEDEARCTHNYMKNAKIVMHVCGTCGRRCPRDRYQEVELLKVPVEHWIRVPVETDGSALERMHAWQKMSLVKHEADGRYTTHDIERKEIHNMVHITEDGGGYYHIIPEAVYDDDKVELCSRCAVGYENKSKPKQRERDVSSEAQANNHDAEQIEYMDVDMFDNLDDLYYESAPQNTIAAGEDFGNLNALKKHGIITDLTSHEMLVLAEARCHYVALKLEAQDKSGPKDKVRTTFSGNAIVMPHKPETTEQEFGAEALKAALGAIRVFFVGPNGTQGQLEKIALRIDDFRLRPEVIYNFLLIKHVLHGTEKTPAIELVKAMINTHGNITQHVRETVSWLEADTRDLEKTPETVVKTTKQGRATGATKTEPKLEVEQALALAPASAAGAATTVVAGKDAHLDASKGKSTTTTPDEKLAKVPRTAAADEHKFKIDTATAPPLEPAADTAPWDQLEEAPKGCAQIGG